MKPAELTVDRVAAWSRAIQRVRAVNTARHVLGHLRQICQYALRQGWIAENPVSRLERHEKTERATKGAAVLTDPS